MSQSTENYIRLGTLVQFASHTRFLITLRAGKSKYRSLLLFKLASSFKYEAGTVGTTSNGRVIQMYIMEATCPHLGADLSHAEVEECEDDSFVAVCPWHRYDFDLRTGNCEAASGLRACVYTISLRGEEIWVEPPSDEIWELVELRPVSEDFADPPKPSDSLLPLPQGTTQQENSTLDPIVPLESPPTTLLQWATLILNTASATLKVARTRHAVSVFRNGQLKSLGRGSSAPLPPNSPPREAGIHVVDPSKVAKRGKGGSAKGRIAMLHALANIEQWAIDLAWDIIARFGNDTSLPHQFYTDFSRVALDEAKHFTLLSNRLIELGTSYGSLPIHSSLWSSAMDTSHSLKSRLAIIHLVHEARGLDVNPATIEKFRRSGDLDSVSLLEIIHHDEITHVTCGHRWFTWLCEKESLDPVVTFRKEVRDNFTGGLKGPFNESDRKKAGMGREFYEDLRGEEEARVIVGYETAAT